MVQDLEFDFTVMKTLRHTVPQNITSSISNDFYLLLQRIISSDVINTDDNQAPEINEWVDKLVFL